MHRCPQCHLPCKSATGVKIHQTKSHPKAKTQNFDGTLADKAVQVKKLTAQQKTRPKIFCEGSLIENIFKFKYLGSLFASDGRQSFDIDARIAKAMLRCGKLRHLFDADHLSLNLKLRLYSAAVCSLLTYGMETWYLNPLTIRRINGANSRMLARITGNTIHHEARASTTTFNLTLHLRRRRFLWLGKILRDDPSRIIFQMLYEQKQLDVPGDLFMDAPSHFSLEELQLLSRNELQWNRMAGLIN